MAMNVALDYHHDHRLVLTTLHRLRRLGESAVPVPVQFRVQFRVHALKKKNDVTQC
jgi:hypothetical protein